MRAFRRFVRKETLYLSEVDEIKARPVHLQGTALAVRLHLPDEFVQNPRYARALVILFFSHSYFRKKRARPVRAQLYAGVP